MMTSKLKTDSTEDRSNYTSRKINAREARPVFNDEPDESIKRKGFSGKNGTEPIDKARYMDGSEVHDSLKDNIDESIAPKEDSEGEEAGIPDPIGEAASIPKNDYTKILLLDDEHEIVRVKNDELSAIDQNTLIDNCIEVSNEFQNEEVYRSSRNGKINTGASKDDNYEEAMSKSYTASKDTPPDSKNRNEEHFHQKQNNETKIHLG